jgi:hypothetical protein
VSSEPQTEREVPAPGSFPSSSCGDEDCTICGNGRMFE